MKKVIIKIVNLFMILVVLFSINNICFGIRLMEDNTIYNENVVSDKIFSNDKNENQFKDLSDARIFINEKEEYEQDFHEVIMLFIEIIKSIILKMFIICFIINNFSIIYKNENIKKLKWIKAFIISIIFEGISVIIFQYMENLEMGSVVAGIITFLILIVILIITELKKKYNMSKEL